MKKTIAVLLAIIGFMMIAGSCRSGTPGEAPDKAPDRAAASSDPSELHDAAFKGSSYLKQMDDLKAINLAANFLKGLGETVTFQETYIEFHEAQKAAVEIPLADGESVEYLGDYLEVRLYDSDDPEDPCEECTVVYISQDGKVLGQNKLSEDDETEEGQENKES